MGGTEPQATGENIPLNSVSNTPTLAPVPQTNNQALLAGNRNSNTSELRYIPICIRERLHHAEFTIRSIAKQDDEEIFLSLRAAYSKAIGHIQQWLRRYFISFYTVKQLRPVEVLSYPITKLTCQVFRFPERSCHSHER